MKKVTADSKCRLFPPGYPQLISGRISNSPVSPNPAINKENSGQALFAGVEELVHKIGLDAHAACEKKRNEDFGKWLLLMQGAEHLGPLDPESGAVSTGGCSGRMQGAGACQRLFANEIAGGQESDGSLLAVFRDDSQLRAAALEIDDRVSGLALRKKDPGFREVRQFRAQGRR